MARAFADITFTDSVKAAQSLYGSRDFNRRFELSPEPRNRITANDEAFIAARDSFYQASVGENGWPYVQHRGGPKGFLRVLDNQTLAYADFSGNRQYISVGNFLADDRVTLFLMDYAHRQRLKIWGRVSVIHKQEDAALFTSLVDRNYTAPIERAVVIRVEALEWNCSKYITPRYTEADINAAVAPILEENNTLKLRIAELELQMRENK